MELLKFKKEMFEDSEDYPKGWHLMVDVNGFDGEYTLCGVAFDGDANSSGAEADIKIGGKVTCQKCIDVIKFCKQIKL